MDLFRPPFRLDGVDGSGEAAVSLTTDAWEYSPSVTRTSRHVKIDVDEGGMSVSLDFRIGGGRGLGSSKRILFCCCRFGVRDCARGRRLDATGVFLRLGVLPRFGVVGAVTLMEDGGGRFGVDDLDGVLEARADCLASYSSVLCCLFKRRRCHLDKWAVGVDEEAFGLAPEVGRWSDFAGSSSFF